MRSEQVFSNVIWRFGERLLSQAASFVVSVILGRLLLPRDFGIVAMATVFILISSVFVTSGFGMSLIQKEDADDLDFSTILIFSFWLSMFLYGLLFLAAPLAARFYKEPLLTPVLRFIALQLPLTSIQSVQQAYVARHMLFRKLFFSTFLGTVISGVIGVSMALAGFGVWSLVAQTIANILINTVALAVSVGRFPPLHFSRERLRGLYGFGWRILLSDLIATIYNELRHLVIGRRYEAEQLAFYDRGQQIPHLLITNLGVAITSVLFPTMAKVQSDKDRLRNITRTAVRTGTYLLFPVMAGLAVVARSLVELLLTGRWLPAVPFLRLACLTYAFDLWSGANLQAIKALGEAHSYLRLEIRKKTIALLLLAASIPFGVTAIAASAGLYSLVAVVMTAVQSDRHIDYPLRAQFRDALPGLLMSMAMALCIAPLSLLEFPSGIILFLQVIVGATIYIGLSVLTNNESFLLVRTMVSTLLRKGAGRRQTETADIREKTDVDA